MTTTVVHCSDIHFGRGFLPECAEAFVATVKTLAPDAVVIAGDLTLRARRHQFHAARRWLDRLERPLLVIPGNHDVPLYNLVLRLLAPFHNYRMAIGGSTTQTLELPDAAIFGVNSVTPFRHQQGRISDADMQQSMEWLDRVSAPWRIVVTHQHFYDLPGHRRPGAFPNASVLLEKWASRGVHAVLHGHTHYPSLVDARRLFPGLPHPLLLIGSGTLSNRRVRGPGMRTNSFQCLVFAPETLSVTCHRWHAPTTCWVADTTETFDRAFFSSGV